MINKKYAFVGCNEKFLEIVTRSFTGGLSGDPKGEDIYLEPLADCKTIGEAILKALAKSRDLSETEEEKNMNITDEEWRNLKPDRWLLTPVAAAERYKEWVKRVMKEYKYKTKRALFQNMQHVSVKQNEEHIIFEPTNHESIDGFSGDGMSEDLNVVIPANSSPEIIGAAAKYAIGNCRGKGTDFMRNLLFPEGQPASFELYASMLDV